MILSIDTSNYTTSACLFDGKECVWQHRILLHPKKGEKGLRQSEAVFQHIKNFEMLFSDFPAVDRISMVCASEKPCSEPDSYMPCFMVGKEFASAISKIHNIPYCGFTHQQNHIAAGLFSGNCLDWIRTPFLACHVSGGTTDILYVTPQKEGIAVEKVGGSIDLHAGQLIDRLGVAMNLLFPCGPEVEKLALKEELPQKTRPSVKGPWFHLSGFENKAMEILTSQGKEKASRYVLDAVAESLRISLENVSKTYGSLPILMVGGVMSNSIIRKRLSDSFSEICYATPFFSCDHALGNAVLGHLFEK